MMARMMADRPVTSSQWGAALFEFGTTWLLIQRDGKCHKEDVRGAYDVSLL